MLKNQELEAGKKALEAILRAKAGTEVVVPKALRGYLASCQDEASAVFRKKFDSMRDSLLNFGGGAGDRKRNHNARRWFGSFGLVQGLDPELLSELKQGASKTEADYTKSLDEFLKTKTAQDNAWAKLRKVQ